MAKTSSIMVRLSVKTVTDLARSPLLGSLLGANKDSSYYNPPSRSPNIYLGGGGGVSWCSYNTVFYRMVHNSGVLCIMVC